MSSSTHSTPHRQSTTAVDSDTDIDEPVILPLVATPTQPLQPNSPMKKTRARTASAAAAAAAATTPPETVPAATSAASSSSLSSPADASIASLTTSPNSKRRKLSRGAEAASATPISTASSTPASSASTSTNEHSRRAIGSSSKENAAAARIQALVRGVKARSAHKKSLLFHAWSELDWKEEQALMNSHSTYEALKKAVTSRVDSKKLTSSPSTAGSKKKGKRTASMTPEEEERACGLLLRDKDPMTFTWVSALMEHFRQNKLLPQSLVFKLLARAEPLFTSLTNIVDVQVTARMTVVGDLHGQLDDLLAIFKLTGFPNSRNKYIFNGDVVDRGQHSIECLLVILAWKILMPNDVFLNRGNHEARDLNGRDGFERECVEKYNIEVFDGCSRLFSALPLAHIIDGQVFVTHGGLFPDCPTLEEIQKVDRFHEIPPTGSTMEYILWSDPMAKKGREESPRGAGILFGPDVSKQWLKKNNLQLIVRSHECMSKGFKMHHNDQVITVFSASNYCGTVGNDGALVVFERDGDTAMTSATSARAAQSTAQKDKAMPVTPTHRSARLAAKEIALPTPPPPVEHSASHPQLKRSIIQFYAAAKEKQGAYRVVGGSNLESDIISKLLHIISDHRLHLTDYWGKHSQSHSTGVRTVTRAVWAQGLKTVLGLTIPFLESWCQDLLGLPKLGVDGKLKGSIDYMAFLARFRPVNLVVLRAQRREAQQATQQSLSLDPTQETFDPSLDYDPDASPDMDGAAVDTALQSILDLMHKNRFELESLFRYLDYDGDESISHDEFREGIKALKGQLDTPITREQLDKLIACIDEDGDGSISYSEFLRSFDLEDPTLRTHLQRSKSIHEGRTAPKIRVGIDEDDNALTPPQSLSPVHGADQSPPRMFNADTGNDNSDHDATSTSHMAK